jgi:hypothetical protein
MTIDRVAPMARRVYQLRVTGEMGPATRDAFSDLAAHTDHGETVLEGELRDQAALYSVIERLQALGLDLVEITVADRAK